MRPLLKRIDEWSSPTIAIFGYQYFKEKQLALHGWSIMRDCTFIKISFCPTIHKQFEFIYFWESNIRTTKK